MLGALVVNQASNIYKEETDMLCKQDRFKLKPNFVWREEKDGGFLFDADSGKLRITNDTAIRVLQYCDGEHALEAIINSVSRDFENVPHDTIERDTRGFLEKIIHEGFVILEGC